MATLLIITILIALLFNMYVFVRNFYVHDYLSDLNRRCANVVDRYNASIPRDNITEEHITKYQSMINIYEEISMRLSYEKVLFSFKPLRDKYWLTKRQQEFLNQTIEQ